MAVEIKVPVLPESVSDATIATWHKKPGDMVKRDENLVDIETDKVVLEVVAPSDGTLETILKPQGALVHAEETIAHFNSSSIAQVLTQASPAEVPSISTPGKESVQEPIPNTATAKMTASPTASPTVRRLMSEHEIKASDVAGTGKSGRITKDDVLSHITGAESKTTEISTAPQAIAPPTVGVGQRAREEQRVPMSRLRARIAERLVQAQQNAAILTTFNEVNMQPVMNLRNQYKESFEKKFGVRLGFMSFFIMAAVAALKRFPAVNASIENQDIIYHGYYDIGVAVASPRGLVVPVLRDVDLMDAQGIERKISEYGRKAQDGQLGMDEITGGTFTISNGGVFGSMMSTPIINPPQSAILGMHKIEERPIVEKGQIVIRPMMYLALSYDHRIIDGSESVRFLVTIKDILEDPARLLLGV